MSRTICDSGSILASSAFAIGQARLAIKIEPEHTVGTGMKAIADGRRVELGRHIVADPRICGGQPTFKHTRIMVWIVLEQIDEGMTWDEIVAEWGGKVSKDALMEAIAIADLVVKHKPFEGFHAGARRKSARKPAAIAA